MANPLLILTLVVPLSTAPETPAQSTDTPFENVHVAVMVQQKMPEKMILYVIQTRPTKFDTSPAALDALRGLGVSETIIRAMVAASPPPAVPDPAAATTVRSTGEEPARPMTNADVVAMVKAQLPESTILLAIQHSASRFDTSPAALIELKDTGVTQSVIEAMIKAGTKTAPAEPSPGTAPSWPSGMPDWSSFPGAAGSVGPAVYYKSPAGELVPLQEVPYGGASSKTSVARFMFNAAPDTVRLYPGPEAPVRIAEPRPVFVAKGSAWLAQGTRLAAIVSLEKKKRERQLRVRSIGYEVRVSYRDEDVTEVSLTQQPDGTLEISPKTNLKPGEYLLSFDTLGGGYDFGIDAKR
jgi:hypothetical protein